MNTGELNLQKLFFNSQLQLNNDWFVSKKSDSSFDNILKTKANESSEVRPADKYRGFNNETHERGVGVKFEDKRTNFESRRDTLELREAIHEKISQYKMKKELKQVENNIEGETDKMSKLEVLHEKIEALEKVIKKELGLEEEPDVMAQIAALLGMDVEALVEQLTLISDGEMETTELVSEVVELIQSEDFKVGEFTSNLVQLVREMPENLETAFEEVLKEVELELEQTDAQVLKPILNQLQEKAVELPTEAVETQQTDVDPKVNTENVKTDNSIQTEATQVEGKEVEIVEVKQQTSEQNESKSFAQGEKPMFAEIKETETNANKVSFDEQVNLMKSEASMITSNKSQPRVALSRSIMNQVVQGTKMSVNLSDQGSEILIKLNPKNLGNVALKMAFEKGVLLAEIQVENQTVKGIIENNLDELRNALQEEGYSIGDLDVSVNKENSGQSQQNFSQHFKQQSKQESFEEFEERVRQENIVNDQAVDYLA
jgi:flagellar hook-length control protein FliK